MIGRKCPVDQRCDGIERGVAIQNCRTRPSSLVHAEPDGGQVVDELPRTLNYASADACLSSTVGPASGVASIRSR